MKPTQLTRTFQLQASGARDVCSGHRSNVFKDLLHCIQLAEELPVKLVIHLLQAEVLQADEAANKQSTRLTCIITRDLSPIGAKRVYARRSTISCVEIMAEILSKPFWRDKPRFRFPQTASSVWLWVCEGQSRFLNLGNPLGPHDPLFLNHNVYQVGHDK